jgi:hypothetical protein
MTTKPMWHSRPRLCDFWKRHRLIHLRSTGGTAQLYLQRLKDA